MKGKLFVIEGIDGSGKQTQTQKIYTRLKSEGYNIRQATFPNYASKSSLLAKMYLNGEFGSNASEIDARVSSSFFAIDRFATFKADFEDFYENGGIIISDRYTTSNMLHQASKITDTRLKDEFLSWLYKLEYEVYNIPKPECVFFLDIPPEQTRKLTCNRKNKIDNSSSLDIHESDSAYIKNSYQNARYLIDKFSWIPIRCVDKNGIISIEEIHSMIYNSIIQYL